MLLFRSLLERERRIQIKRGTQRGGKKNEGEENEKEKYLEKDEEEIMETKSGLSGN